MQTGEKKLKSQLITLNRGTLQSIASQHTDTRLRLWYDRPSCETTGRADYTAHLIPLHPHASPKQTRPLSESQ